MALLRLSTVVNPATATAVASGTFLIYNSDNINWLTLASKQGSGGAASTFFDYQLLGGGVGKAVVRGSIGAIQAAAGASTVTP